MKTNISTLLQRLDRRSFLHVSAAFGLAGMAARSALGIVVEHNPAVPTNRLTTNTWMR